MAATVRDRVRAYRQPQTLSLPDGPAKPLARGKVILRTYPASCRERLDNVLTKFGVKSARKEEGYRSMVPSNPPLCHTVGEFAGHPWGTTGFLYNIVSTWHDAGRSPCLPR